MTTITTASWRKGLWYFFEFEGHQVSVNVHPLNGREQVFVNDERVIDTYVFRITRRHELQVAGRSLSLILGMDYLLDAISYCELRVEDEPIARAQARLWGGAWLPFLAGALSGSLGAVAIDLMGVL